MEDWRRSEAGRESSFAVPLLVKLLKEKEAGRRENRLGFSFSGLETSLSFLTSLFFRPKLKDGRRESVDCRGVMSLGIGAFMLVGGYFFSLGVSLGV